MLYISVLEIPDDVVLLGEVRLKVTAFEILFPLTVTEPDDGDTVSLIMMTLYMNKNHWIL